MYDHMFYANQTKILPLLIPRFSFDMKAQHVIFFFFLTTQVNTRVCSFSVLKISLLNGMARNRQDVNRRVKHFDTK